MALNVRLLSPVMTTSVNILAGLRVPPLLLLVLRMIPLLSGPALILIACRRVRVCISIHMREGSVGK